MNGNHKRIARKRNDGECSFSTGNRLTLARTDQITQPTTGSTPETAADRTVHHSMPDLNNLKASIGNLNDQFGRATPGVATVINLFCVGVGVLVGTQTQGIVSLLGYAFAILCGSAILKWVIAR